MLFKLRPELGEFPGDLLREGRVTLRQRMACIRINFARQRFGRDQLYVRVF